MAVFERGLEVGVVAGDDHAFGVGVDVAALELGLAGRVLARGGPVAVIESLLGGFDPWTLGGVLARGLVERLCVAAVAPVAGDLGVLVRGGRLVLGERDLAAGVVDGLRFVRVALEGGTELVGFLAYVWGGPVAQLARALLDVYGELLGAIVTEAALEFLAPPRVGAAAGVVRLGRSASTTYRQKSWRWRDPATSAASPKVVSSPR